MSETVRYAIGTFLGLGSFGALLYLKGRFDGRHAERAAAALERHVGELGGRVAPFPRMPVRLGGLALELAGANPAAAELLARLPLGVRRPCEHADDRVFSSVAPARLCADCGAWKMGADEAWRFPRLYVAPPDAGKDPK